MKHVVGNMKLRLAQFVELESFSKFSSDLDSKTKKILTRGTRLREILKQRISRPLQVTDQICLVHAAMGGYFDKVALSEVTLVGNQIIRGLSYFFPAFNYRVPLMTSQNTDKENELCCSYFLEKYLHWVINLRKFIQS